MKSSVELKNCMNSEAKKKATTGMIGCSPKRNCEALKPLLIRLRLRTWRSPLIRDAGASNGRTDCLLPKSAVIRMTGHLTPRRKALRERRHET